MNILDKNRIDRKISCELIIIDNFYENPIETRDFALSQDYFTNDYYPGKRTKSFSTDEHKNKIQHIIKNFGGKITTFNSNNGDNGSFQYTISSDRSWIHTDDNDINWAGIVYLTPDAPISSGTGFFKFKDGTMNIEDQMLLNNKEITNKYSRDITKWELVDKVANKFNRLILFKSSNFHMSLDYFGTDKYNGRLFQVFFFSTEY